MFALKKSVLLFCSLNFLVRTPDSLAHRNRSDFCDLRLRCPSRTPEIARFPRQDKAMLHCDLRVRWKVASDLRFRAAISEPKTPSFCCISGDLAQSTRRSLALAIVRFWRAKPDRISRQDPEKGSATGRGFGNLIERAQLLPVPVLDQGQFPPPPNPKGK